MAPLRVKVRVSPVPAVLEVAAVPAVAALKAPEMVYSRPLSKRPEPDGVALAAAPTVVAPVVSNTPVTPVSVRVQVIVDVIAVGGVTAANATTVPKAKVPPPLNAPTVQAEVRVAVTLKVLEPTAACEVGAKAASDPKIAARVRSFFILISIKFEANFAGKKIYALLPKI